MLFSNDTQHRLVSMYAFRFISNLQIILRSCGGLTACLELVLRAEPGEPNMKNWLYVDKIRTIYIQTWEGHGKFYNNDDILLQSSPRKDWLLVRNPKTKKEDLPLYFRLIWDILSNAALSRPSITPARKRLVTAKRGRALWQILRVQTITLQQLWGSVVVCVLRWRVVQLPVSDSWPSVFESWSCGPFVINCDNRRFHFGRKLFAMFLLRRCLKFVPRKNSKGLL